MQCTAYHFHLSTPEYPERRRRV
uniref:Uncharacterized protein n=1 Tax=Anguilla anguilla TaxID=7936 RepID=A0A0E9PS86_ANGAN